MKGYNLGEAQKLIDSIHENYVNLNKTIKNGWGALRNVMKTEWPNSIDENQYEIDFATRLIELSEVSSGITNMAMDTICELAKAWYEFQRKNTLNGETIAMNMPFNLVVDKVSPVNDVDIESGGLDYDPKSFSGLLNKESSKTQIETQIDTFVNDVTTAAEQLANDISTERAFAGDQSRSIKDYLDRCTVATASIATSVKDIKTALDILAGKNYNESDEKVVSNLTEGKVKVDDFVESAQLGRWQ